MPNYNDLQLSATMTIDNATITGVTFSNGTFTYDGTAHSIFVSGLPTGATVTYTGNAQTNAGVYTVDALVQMPNYNDLQLSATMTIDNATITGVMFNNGT
ncbi:MBG domain-containing protein, partial [Flavobacterium solisilvae]